MAAPPEKTIRDLSGDWVVNYTLSDSPDPALVIQGISYLVRMTIKMATISLKVNQYEGPPSEPNTSTDLVTHVDIVQTASGVSSTEEKRCLDSTSRGHTDWLFGTVEGYSRFVSLDEVEDEYLKKNWLEEGEAGGKNFILSHVDSKDADWTATQIWGFQERDGVRYYARNIVVQKPGARAELTMFYDWYVEPDAEE